MKNYLSYVLLMTFVLALSVPLLNIQVVSAAPSSTDVIVKTNFQHNPAYQWCQRFNGEWISKSEEQNFVSAPDVGGAPQKTKVRTKFTFPTPTSDWYDHNVKPYSLSQLVNPKITGNPAPSPTGDNQPLTMTKLLDYGNQYIRVEGFAGAGTGGKVDSGICGTNKGYTTPIWVDAKWEATVPLSLEINIPSKTILKGDEVQLKISAVWGYANGTKREAIPANELTWVSDAKAKVPVDDNGLVKGEASTNGGFATVKATWAKYGVAISSKITVNVGTATGSFDFVPSKITYGDSFSITPSKAVVPLGKTLKNITYRMYNPIDRSKYKDFTTGSMTSIGVNASQYPSFIADTSSTYTADMILTDNTGETYNVYSNQISIAPKGNPDGGGITGDFDVTPSKIKFRDNFGFVPKNIKTTGICTYKSHKYKIDRQGYELTTNPVVGETKATDYYYGSYPSNVGTGYHAIYMKITSSCGETDWIGPKPLVIESDGKNTPPEIKIGFVRSNDITKVVTSVIQGETLDLMHIRDNSIPVPFDADGDDIEFIGFDFSKSTDWVKTIPHTAVEGAEAYHRVKMDVLGVHWVEASARDDYGGLTTARTYINVIPPNPSPIPQCPTEVTANKPYAESLFSGKYSQSPKGYNNINHNRYEWINKPKLFRNTTDDVIQVQVGLHVYDLQGLRSLEPAECTVNVKPDLPPVAKLSVPSLTVRLEPSYIVNNSYSPDEDVIASAEYKYKYDASNNGFNDDSWQKVASTDTEGFAFTAPKVGRYLFYSKVTENNGKWAETSITDHTGLILDVTNRAPTVSFDIAGENKQPPGNDSTLFTVQDMYNNWTLKQPNSDRDMLVPREASWSIRDGMLYSGKALNFYPENELQIYTEEKPGYGGTYNVSYMPTNADFGLGSNSLSPYRGVDKTKPTRVTPILTEDIRDITATNDYLFYLYTNDVRDYDDSSISLHATRYDKIPESICKTDQARVDCEYKTPYIPFEISTTKDALFKEWSNVDPEYIEDYWLSEEYLYVRWYLSLDDGYDKYSHNHDIIVYSLKDFSLSSKVQQKDHLTYLGNDTFFYAEAINGLDASGKWSDYIKYGYIDPRGNRTANEYHVSSWSEFPKALEDIVNLHVQKKETGTRYDLVKPDRKNSDGSYTPYKLREFGSDHLGNRFFVGGYGSWGAKQTQYQYHEAELIKSDPNFQKIWSRSFPNGKSDTHLTCHVGPDENWGGIMGCTSVVKYDISNKTIVVSDFDRAIVNGQQTGRNSTAQTYTIDPETGNVLRISEDYADATWQGMLAGSDRVKTSFDFDGRTNRGFGTYTIDNQLNDVGYQPLVDGKGLQWNNYYPDNNYGNVTMRPTLIVGTPTTGKKAIETLTSGQFISTQEVSDVEMKFTFKSANKDYDTERFGLSFRMRNVFDKYALEFDGNNMFLMKYAGGVGTLLNQAYFPIQDNVSYNVAVKTIGSKLDVTVNNTPYFSIQEASYASGTFGYFSNKAYMNLGVLSTNVVKEPLVEWMKNYAIWEPSGGRAEVKYENLNFDDPERDPMAGMYTWNYKHTPKFLRNHGISALDGQVVTSPEMIFDKVGLYEVTLKAKDDPHPDYLSPNQTFESYRKDSNSFINTVTVHRRPVANFTLAQQGDGKISWSDYSYDPDRWMSNGEYSAPDTTGINYQTTKGVISKKFYYISPSGKRVDAKLTAPQELGVYEVGLSVVDEYGAWSEWAVQTINTGTIVADGPPISGFVATPEVTYRGVPIRITSTAYDEIDGGSSNLDHKYYIRNIYESVESLQSIERVSWSKTFSSVGTFNIRQVVTDSNNSSAETSKQVTIVNRQPKVNVTVPDGTAGNPTMYDYLAPTIKWDYDDEDGDPQNYYDVKVYRIDGTLVAHTQTQSAATRSWITPSLVDNIHYYVQVAVHDGYEWAWSHVTHFRIETNKPPIAKFDYSPNPLYEGDVVTFSNQSIDPDGDPLTYNWTINGPNGYINSSTAKQPAMNWINPGIYKVTLEVTDGHESSSLTKLIQVHPLTLTGEVRHTDEWLEHLLTWNDAHSTEQRNLDTYWAGESFVLVANPTQTGTATIPVRVKVSAQDIGTVSLHKQTSGTWTGHMTNDDAVAPLEQLADGAYDFVFTVTYSNGVTKSTTATINILGKWDDYFRLHRQY